MRDTSEYLYLPAWMEDSQSSLSLLAKLVGNKQDLASLPKDFSVCDTDFGYAPRIKILDKDWKGKNERPKTIYESLPASKPKFVSFNK
jgi:hypothetical protein